jgi:hypothetical protein
LPEMAISWICRPAAFSPFRELLFPLPLALMNALPVPGDFHPQSSLPAAQAKQFVAQRLYSFRNLPMLGLDGRELAPHGPVESTVGRTEDAVFAAWLHDRLATDL